MTNNPTIDGVSRELIERAISATRLARGPGSPTERDLRALLDAPAVERQEPVLQIPEECPHLIVFDDADRENLMFSGAGAREAAMKTWEQISLSWNAHLFVRVERNSRDDRYPSATATALQSTIARLEARIAELESGRGEPFFYGIIRPDGKPHYSELCVSGEASDLESEAESWTEDGDGVYRVIPLFTAPPATAGIVLPELESSFEKWWEEDGQYCRAGGGSYEKTFAYRAYEACLDAAAALNTPKPTEWYDVAGDDEGVSL